MVLFVNLLVLKNKQVFSLLVQASTLEPLPVPTCASPHSPGRATPSVHAWFYLMHHAKRQAWTLDVCTHWLHLPGEASIGSSVDA